MALPSISNRLSIPTFNVTPPSGGGAGPAPTSSANLSPTGLTPRGSGGLAPPRLASLVSKAMLPGSGASSIASAMNPLTNSPTLTAANNLTSTAAGDPASGMAARHRRTR
jgi:hypothetical protein